MTALWTAGCRQPAPADTAPVPAAAGDVAPPLAASAAPTTTVAATAAKPEPAAMPTERPPEPEVGPDEPWSLDIEYVPTPDNVVAKMLEAAAVGPDDLLIDLGCGDGRLLVEAAKRGARARGYDLDPERIAEARANIEKAGVGDRVTVARRNIFDVDLSEATVVTLYLLPSINVKLIPQLEKLRPGARIISHDFDMEGVEYDDVWTVMAVHHRPPHADREHYVYKYSAPLRKVSVGKRKRR
ncbi:MAG: class I SAM-dependent methyltransferase [Nannocystaceae bacterium]